MKHLADLLTNRVNSQWYPSIYEDWRPKIIEDIEKSDGKERASGQQSPWDQWGPGQLKPQTWGPPGLPQGSWERARSTAPSPAKQGLSSTKRDLYAWSCWGEYGRSGKHTGAVCTHWDCGHWLGRVGQSQTLTWSIPSLFGEWGCVRPGTCFEWQAWTGGICQKEKEKKEALSGGWGILL